MEASFRRPPKWSLKDCCLFSLSTYIDPTGVHGGTENINGKPCLTIVEERRGGKQETTNKVFLYYFYGFYH